MEQRSALLAVVAQELTELRLRAGIDVEDAARSAGVEPERLAAAEDGEAVLDGSELDALAAAYGVDVTRFFGGRTTPLTYLAGA